MSAHILREEGGLTARGCDRSGRSRGPSARFTMILFAGLADRERFWPTTESDGLLWTPYLGPR